MAIDSEAKRRTTLKVLPVPDNATSEEDRRRSIYIYGFSGVEAIPVLADYTLSIDNCLSLIGTSSHSIESVLYRSILCSIASDTLLYDFIGANHSIESAVLLNPSQVAAIEFAGILSNHKEVPLDTLKQTVANQIVSQESLSNVQGINTISLESLYSIFKNHQISIENILSLVINQEINSSSMLSIQHNRSIAIEILSSISSNNDIAINTLVYVLLPVLSDAPVSIETLESLYVSQTNTVDTILSMLKTNSISFETLLRIATQAEVVAESNVNHILSFHSNIETATMLYSQKIYNTETLGHIGYSLVLGLGAVSRFSNRLDLPIDSICGFVLNKAFPVTTNLACLVYKSTNIDALGTTKNISSVSKETVLSVANIHSGNIETIVEILVPIGDDVSIDTILGVLANLDISLDIESLGFVMPAELSVSRERGTTVIRSNDTVVIIHSKSPEAISKVLAETTTSISQDVNKASIRIV